MRMKAFVLMVTVLSLAGCKGSGDEDGQGRTGGAMAGQEDGGGVGGFVAPVGGIVGGSGDGTSGGLAGIGGTLVATGGAGAQFDGGVDGGVDGGPPAADGARADSGTMDVNPHGGASLWIPFNNPATGGTYYFDRCTWFTQTDGYCVLLKNNTSSTGTKTSDVLQTKDGGRSFTLLATIDGGNTAFDGDMDVVVSSPSEIWYTTAFVGMGYSGTIGRSLDGGKSFQSLTESVHLALADPGTTSVPNSPLWRLVKVDGRVWVGSYSKFLASSADGGATWQRHAGPLDLTQAEAPVLIATRQDLLLQYKRDSMIELYRWNGTTFGKAEASFPAPSNTDHGDTWWRASPFGDGIVFIDQRQYGWWGWPFAVNATVDAGRSFKAILSGQSASTSDVVGLRDALVVNGSLAYVCGVFVGADKNRYSQIRKSTDGGQTWSVVHSEPTNNTYASVVLDATGRPHAVRHVTDAYSNIYNYTGHYVLP